MKLIIKNLKSLLAGRKKTKYISDSIYKQLYYRDDNLPNRLSEGTF